jgi:hypothetical protein
MAEKALFVSLLPAVLLICAGKMQIAGTSASSCSGAGAASQDMMMGFI